MTVQLSRPAGDTNLCARNPQTGALLGSCTRTPLTSYGVSMRANLLNFLILRLDYSRPLQRSVGGVWTISLGPTF